MVWPTGGVFGPSNVANRLDDAAGGECVQRRFQGGDEQFPLQKLSNSGFRAAGITPGGLFRCCIVDRPPGQRPAQRGS